MPKALAGRGDRATSSPHCKYDPKALEQFTKTKPKRGLPKLPSPRKRTILRIVLGLAHEMHHTESVESGSEVLLPDEIRIGGTDPLGSRSEGENARLGE